MTFPNDADGRALAAIAASGMDMTTPISIEFAIGVPDENTGKAVLDAVSAYGYQTELYYDEGEPDYQEGDAEEFGPSWTVYAVAQMQPTYENVVSHQAKINKLVSKLGGNCDAWEVKLNS